MFRILKWLQVNWLIVLDIAKTAMLGALLIITINLLGGLGDQTQEIKAQNQQIKILTKQNNNISKQLTQSNQDIKSHIDCIITFFGLPNRAALKISDVCHFQGADGSITPTATTATPSAALKSATASPVSPVQQLPAKQLAPSKQGKSSILEQILHPVDNLTGGQQVPPVTDKIL